MNRLINYATIGLTICLLNCAEKKITDISKLFLVDNSLHYTISSHGEIFLMNLDTEQRIGLEFNPDFIFNDMSYLKYRDNEIEIFENDFLFKINDEQLIGLSGDELFLYGYDNGFYH